MTAEAHFIAGVSLVIFVSGFGPYLIAVLIFGWTERRKRGRAKTKTRAISASEADWCIKRIEDSDIQVSNNAWNGKVLVDYNVLQRTVELLKGKL